MTDDQVPAWACKEWGGYGHDWLDCPACQEKYEVWLDEDIGEEPPGLEEAKPHL